MPGDGRTINRSVFESSGAQEDLTGISNRVAQITVSAIKQMPLLTSKIGGCVSLGQGIPSFNTPEFIREAVIQELRENTLIGKYSLQPGLPALKAAIALDLERTKNVTNIDCEKEIFISCGGMEALAVGISTIVERGDEVILPTPTYASHIEQILFAEGTPVFVPLNFEDNWHLDLNAVRKAITRKTKAIILCNPVNPTGSVFAETELRELAQLVIEHNLFVITDEAYDFLVFDDAPYFSLLSIPELRPHIMAACSFSKRFCMTGWRVGFMFASERLIRQVLKVHDAFAICAPTISQYAALAALRETNGKDGAGDLSVRQLVEAISKRRDLICARLDRLQDLFSYVKPQGGYYVFPKILKAKGSSIEGTFTELSSIELSSIELSSIELSSMELTSVESSSIEFSSMELSLRLLREAKVITIPGGAFGPTGNGHIRLSFGAAEDELQEAFNRIDKWNQQTGS